MLFRQLFDGISCTYTYLLASRIGGEALIIDPVLERLDHYLRLLRELDLKLVKAVDTHLHADHVTALGALRDRTRCITVMGEASGVDVVSMRVREGDRIDIEGIALEVVHTPGHTDDSYTFRLPDRVFTGDTLLIRGTGRTDFQNGDPLAQYDSLFNKLLRLPDDTLVYPCHDYKGDTVSTIGEEKAHNPRLQVGSAAEYAAIMNNLHLPNPKMMDVAVPANRHIAFAPSDAAVAANTLSVDQAATEGQATGATFVDLREDGERAAKGFIPGSVHVPYGRLGEVIRPGGLLAALAAERRLILYCAYGERSALALQACHEEGIGGVRHLGGGIAAWAKAGLPLAMARTA